MADYYPLIARAVAGLEKGTGEARRGLYERARTALVTQLRGVEPALSDADITRERLALEEAIRKVEAEATRRARQVTQEMPRANAVPLPRADKPPSSAPPQPQPPVRNEDTGRPPDWNQLRRELDGIASAAQSESVEAPRRETDQPEPEPTPPVRRLKIAPLPSREDLRPEVAESQPAAPSNTAAQDLPVLPRSSLFSAQRMTLVDEGLRDFRNVVGGTEDNGEATASAAPPVGEPREATASAPRPVREMREANASASRPVREPREANTSAPRPARETREAVAAAPRSQEIERAKRRVRPENLRPPAQEIPPPPRPAPDGFEESQKRPLRPPSGGNARKIIALAVVLLLLAAAALFAYYQWGGSATTSQSARSPATSAPKEASQARPKISDRIGGAQQDSGRPARDTGAAVAQRAVLYEQQANPQERNQYVGSVIWRTEKSSPGPGQPADVTIKAEVEIPERNMRMSFTLRRNLDQSLPASHTIEILFSTPADFQPGGIADVPNVLMEDTEQRSGAPLTGLRVKVTSGFFLLGLSSVESDVRRNVQLLKERPWMHIRLAYNNGQRALLAIEKGVPGDRAFEEALNAWGQNPPSPSR